MSIKAGELRRLLQQAEELGDCQRLVSDMDAGRWGGAAKHMVSKFDEIACAVALRPLLEQHIESLKKELGEKGIEVPPDKPKLSVVEA